MQKRDYRDIMGGGLLLLVGGGAAIYSLLELPIGSISRMGPGMFPIVVGIFVAAMGLMTAIPAFLREGTPIAFDIRAAVMILLSILVFGLMIRPFGLVPSVIAVTILASFASGETPWKAVFALCVVLSLLAVIIFKVGFALQVPTAAWPW